MSRELDMEVAEKVFNWCWWTLPAIGQRWFARSDDDEVEDGPVGHSLGAQRRVQPAEMAELDAQYPWWLDDGDPESVPHYSTSIADAWLVVEKLREVGWLVRVQEMPDGWPWLANRIDEPEMLVRKRCVCLLDWFGHNWQERADWRRHSDPHPVCYGDTSSEAICWAALATCGEGA